MELGAFSVSLTVKDIVTSRAFYEKLGFKVFMGNQAENWLILKNGTCVIGLFQGMFEKNLLTFTPGWSADAQPLEKFMDIRELQQQLLVQGIEIDSEVTPGTNGPASFTLRDPDGNRILFDQHVSSSDQDPDLKKDVQRSKNH
ncbi:MAG TPA: VOC family protein [Anaerolineaceae bacterium]|nr:VOC family protein [Anaerolineaceae bacterium]